MPPHDRPALRAYFTVRPVPARFGPCYVWRAPGRILIAIHPGTKRTDVGHWLLDNLTLDENNAVRWWSGQGPVGTPVVDWMVQDVPVYNLLAQVRLPSEALLYDSDPDWHADAEGVAG